MLFQTKRENGADLISNFLGYYLYKENVDELIYIFKENPEVLEELYISQLQQNKDFENILFNKLIHDNLSFWNKLTIKIKDMDFIQDSHYLNQIFNQVWQKENYEEFINLAVKNIYGEDIDIRFIESASCLFSNPSNSNIEVQKHKKEWLENQIKSAF